MKAVIIHTHGGLEALKYEEVKPPTPGPEEAVIAVKACALNRLDIWVRAGIPGRKIGLPRIPGSDIAGEVAEVGAGVKEKPGDPVVVHAVLSCGKCDFCRDGRDNLCSKMGILGAAADGGYAEFAKVPARNLLPLPKPLSFDEASTAPVVFLTAWHMLVTRGNLRAGEEVLVLAAGSGVGAASIQIAKLCGARVIATAGDDEKVKKAKTLGADEAINYRTSPFDEAVHDLTQGKGVDMVVETIGKETLPKSLDSLRKEGRVVLCGTTSGPTVEIDYRKLYMTHKSVIGSTLGTRGEFAKILTLLADGRLKTAIDRIFPLERAAEAQKVLQDRAQFGKLILHP